MLDLSDCGNQVSESTIRRVFLEHGLRFTRKRATVYRALASTRSHPTAHELHDQVRVMEPKISLATVYNTLDALTGCGLCQRIASSQGAGSARFDADIGPHVHVETSDGAVLDVPDELSDRLLKSFSQQDLVELERRLGVRIKRIDLKVMASPQRPGSMP